MIGYRAAQVLFRHLFSPNRIRLDRYVRLDGLDRCDRNLSFEPSASHFPHSNTSLIRSLPSVI